MVARMLKITKFKIANKINSKVQIHYNTIQWHEVFWVAEGPVS